MLWEAVVILGISCAVNSECPNRCICTEKSIDCSSSQLKNFPNDIFPQLHEETIDKHFLRDKYLITRLNLANNQLEDLKGTLLSDVLPNLETLDLSNNKILNPKKIQSVILSKKLLYFRLSSNPIKNLGLTMDTILYSQSISHLDLSNCLINSIADPISIMYLTNLTNLNLAGNPLFVIDNLHSATLSHLDLSHCLLGINDRSIREEAFKELPNLIFLNLSMNVHLSKFSSSKPLSYSLLNLEASHCAFESTDLRLFPNLQNAVMKGNVIKTLHNEMISFNVNLQSLDISQNSIHHIEEYAFVGSSFLRKLDLSINLLKDLNWNVFLKTPHLESLNISRNLLRSLGQIPLPSLVILDASKCEILELDQRVFSTTQALKYLNLSHNLIENLPRELSSNKLLNFDLSYCRLSNLKHESFQELSALRGLNLMGNRLTNPLNESLLHYLENVMEINLLDNPWHCDCTDLEYRRMWQYLSSYPRKSRQLKNLMCSSPKEHSGMSWEKSCFRSFTNEAERPKTGAWFSFLVPFLTLSCLLAIFVVIRQAYNSNEVETQRRDQPHHRTYRNVETRENSPRIDTHFFDGDFERAIQQSVNDSTQRSPIQDLSKLPSYEEALLLPKLLNSEDLKDIVKNYEERDRFNTSTAEHLQENNFGNSEESSDHPSTSRQSNCMEEQAGDHYSC